MRPMALACVVAMAVGCMVETPSTAPSRLAKSSTPDSKPRPIRDDAASRSIDLGARKWFEGGTLHHASPRIWRNASAENKMATCADFICAAWKAKALPSAMQQRIKDMDDMKPFALALVGELEAAVDLPSDTLDQHSNTDMTGIVKGIMAMWLIQSE